MKNPYEDTEVSIDLLINCKVTKHEGDDCDNPSFTHTEYANVTIDKDALICLLDGTLSLDTLIAEELVDGHYGFEVDALDIGAVTVTNSPKHLRLV